MITQTYIGPIPPEVATAGAVTPLALFIGGLVMWVVFGIIVTAVARSDGGVRGLAAVLSYAFPALGLIMFFAAMGTS